MIALAPENALLLLLDGVRTLEQYAEFEADLLPAMRLLDRNAQIDIACRAGFHKVDLLALQKDGSQKSEGQL